MQQRPLWRTGKRVTCSGDCVLALQHARPSCTLAASDAANAAAAAVAARRAHILSRSGVQNCASVDSGAQSDPSASSQEAFGKAAEGRDGCAVVRLHVGSSSSLRPLSPSLCWSRSPTALAGSQPTSPGGTKVRQGASIRSLRRGVSGSMPSSPSLYGSHLSTVLSGSRLASPTGSGVREDLLSAVRKADLDTAMRMRAALALARLLAQRGEDAGRSEALELEAEIRRARHLLLEDPPMAMELALTCEEAPGLLSALAELICKDLEEDVLHRPQSEVDEAYRYILIDLAERRDQRGEQALAAELRGRKRAAAGVGRDPRDTGRRLAWRFDAEPGPPRDAFRVEVPSSLLDVGLPIMRPLGGTQRLCSCGCRPARPCDMQGTIGASAAEGSQAGAGAAALSDANGAGVSCNAERDSQRFAQVCGELDQKFNLAGCLADLGRKDCSRDEAWPVDHVRAAEDVAWKLVRARRFKIQVVDVPDEMEVPQVMLQGGTARDKLVPCVLTNASHA